MAVASTLPLSRGKVQLKMQELDKQKQAWPVFVFKIPISQICLQTPYLLLRLLPLFIGILLALV
jgi:hypothetical protein